MGDRQIVDSRVALEANLSGVSLVASAQERLFDGVLGAGAGALAFGPVGAVAGGVVGYTAGPNIANGLGVRHPRHYRHRHVYRESRRD